MRPTLSQANRLLRLMPDRAFALVGPDLEPVDLDIHKVIADPGDVISYVYFPESVLVSLVAPMLDGRQPEQATIGREGMVGGLSALGKHEAYSRWLVQVQGRALRCPVKTFERAFGQVPEFRGHVLRYLQALQSQILQSVACNAVHPVDARCARWILTMRDRSDSDELPLTQEFLAQILSVHRSSVTITMSALQDAGYIQTRRGFVRIVDRKGLESTACDCYRLVRDRFERLLPGVFDSD
jgi:CRP-like cAMP-binding protein